jgi:membrane fusion protein (multidrug efflux system)
MKQRIIFLIIGVLAILLIVVKIYIFRGTSEIKAVTVSNPVVPVECFLARDTTVNYQLETVGTLRANEQVEIVSEISRKIVSIYMKEGTRVTKGQLLFKLDDSDIASKINKLSIEVKLAEANEAREKVLYSKGGISQERYEEVSNHRQVLQAEIEVLRVDLSKTSICAPFSGKIGLRNVSEGTLVSPGIVLANLQDLSRMKIDFSIPERYSRNLNTGSRITFHTDYLTEDQSATVESIEPAVNIKTRTLLVRAIAPNGDGRLVAGSSSHVFLTLRELIGSIFIPTSALIPSIRGYSVFLCRSGVAVPAMVKTGVRNRDYIQITEGIRPGDTLIATNLLRVKKDSPLKVVKTY